MAKRKAKKRRTVRRRSSGDAGTQMVKTAGNLMGGMMAMGMASQMMNLVAQPKP
jgi:hypothetical protein